MERQGRVGVNVQMLMQGADVAMGNTHSSLDMHDHRHVQRLCAYAVRQMMGAPGGGPTSMLTADAKKKLLWGKKPEQKLVRFLPFESSTTQQPEGLQDVPVSCKGRSPL